MATVQSSLPSFDKPIRLTLPDPWAATSIAIDSLAPITLLVGPNGTGKSRFLKTFRDAATTTLLNPRLISTERLNSSRREEVLDGLWGSHTNDGLNKSYWGYFLDANHRGGSIIGTITLLYQRPDLRIRVEATLSHLLRRRIRLEMVDGAIKPTAQLGTALEYDLLKGECHGVLELIVLLANIYDDQTKLLLIDEPEQNLHPQYQAFVLDELRRVRNKYVVLATHSPFFLRVKTIGELAGVMCFHPNFSPPSRYTAGISHVDREVLAVLPRMTEQHRSFFFADRPVFVEGHHDATVIGAIQQALDTTAEAAGSCLIPTSGKDEAMRYLLLCNALGKSASFVFDLDALFGKRLSSGVEQMQELVGAITKAGHDSFDRLRGQLESSVNKALAILLQMKAEQVPSAIVALHSYVTVTADHAKRRLGLLVTIASQPEDLRLVVGNTVDTIRGQLNALLEHLASAHIHVLPGGALENYLPSYTGNPYQISDEDKVTAEATELAWLAQPRTAGEVGARYGALARVVTALPAKPRVDILPALRREVANVLHHLCAAVRDGEISEPTSIEQVLGEHWKRVGNFIRVDRMTVTNVEIFSGTLVIKDCFGIVEQVCQFDQNTNPSNPALLSFSATAPSTSV